MDYGKWKYENKKKEKASKKKQTVISIKEIQVRPRTEDHDLNTKLRHARRFLFEGNKVKVNLRFSGREMAHQDLGVDLLNKVIKLLEPMSNVEVTPKREGRQMFILLVPDAAKIKEYEKKVGLGELSDSQSDSDSSGGSDSSGQSSSASSGSSKPAEVTPSSESEGATEAVS